MKSRYNLRLSSNHRIDSSHVTKKSFVRRLTSKITNKSATRRHSLRLNPLIKPPRTRSNLQNNVKSRKIENEHNQEETTTTDDIDNYEKLIARHHRRMLEEQKDRKLYERYVRDQRTLRRLQCRRTHSAHLNEKTRNRLLKELERERRYTVQDQICSQLANNTFLFRHKHHIHSTQPIDWLNLEDELVRTQNQETIRQLDVMINNLKKVTHPSKSNTSKPRLSVHERQKQRLAASSNEITTVVNSINEFQLNTNFNILSRLPVVRFANDENLLSDSQTNPQHLTCIQNVLSSNNRHSTRLATTELSTPIVSRRSKNLSDSSSTNSKKRPLEKENCSLVTSSTPNNIVLRASSPMISIKSSVSTNNSYRTSRKIANLATRRQRRFS